MLGSESDVQRLLVFLFIGLLVGAGIFISTTFVSVATTQRQFAPSNDSSAKDKILIDTYLTKLKSSSAPTLFFGANETALYLKLEFAHIDYFTHQWAAYWFTPQHHLAFRSAGSVTVPLGEARTVVSTTYLHDSPISQLTGLWDVDIYVDGQKMNELPFFLGDSTPPAQPVSRWTWLLPRINVVVPPAPFYAKQDVIAAVKEWNISQVWFQKAFNLSAKPIFALVLSNDSSGQSITIRFNQTQTNEDYWGLGGPIRGMTCPVSLDLSLRRGLVLNDTALRNLALHEIGHCLGLGHVKRAGDLMNPLSTNFWDPLTPTTLNLYAVYQLAGTPGFQISELDVSLPDGITYLRAPEINS